MLVQIICGVVAYKLFRRYLSSGNPASELISSLSDLYFATAARLEWIYGGRCFVGLRIPDPDSGSRQHVDVVLVTKREVILVAVRNFDGDVEVDKDGQWACAGDQNQRKQLHPDPIQEVNHQVANLRSYLEQRGAPVSKAHISGKVLLVNPNCRPSVYIASQPEVVTFDDWRDLKPDMKSKFSNWVKETFQGGKTEVQHALPEKLIFVLSTSPMWDRLVLDGDKHVLGEFIEFKASSGEMQHLKNLKRSKVSQLVVQKTILFGSFGRSKLQLLYSPRDYRTEGATSSDWKEISVKRSAEILFQPLHSKKPQKIKLSAVSSLTLSP